ncbi:hypothetical protein EVG20_g2550 [Dentipellis fragilis]|uniref:Uncharacterized protein n=1 Tax=Dentipellis fragilis TaxID=205917 RepID=A0A4Y9Z6U9_9AGAM|nr:hypothetical protein EVG20_g2550 [Dentipellis fragilis]
MAWLWLASKFCITTQLVAHGFDEVALAPFPLPLCTVPTPSCVLHCISSANVPAAQYNLSMLCLHRRVQASPYPPFNTPIRFPGPSPSPTLLFSCHAKTFPLRTFPCAANLPIPSPTTQQPDSAAKLFQNPEPSSQRAAGYAPDPRPVELRAPERGTAGDMSFARLHEQYYPRPSMRGFSARAGPLHVSAKA